MKNKVKSSRRGVFSIGLIAVSVIMVFGFLLSGCAPSNENIEAAKELVNEADELVQEYRYADAMDKFEAAREKDNGNVNIYTGIAAIYLLKNRTNDAKGALDVGIAASRKPSDAYMLLGSMSLDEGDTDTAIENLKKAVQKDGKNYQAQYLLAKAYVNALDFDNARKELDVSEDGGEWYARSLFLKAILFGDNTEDAAEAISDAKNVDVEEETLSGAIAQYDETIKKIDALTEEETSEQYVDVILAHGALVAGYEDVVIDLLEKHLDSDEESEYWDLYLYLGQAYRLGGDMEKAEEYLSNAITLNPADPSGPWNLARVYDDQGMDTEMEENYVRAIALSKEGNRVAVRKEYTDVLLKNGQYATADEQLLLLEGEDAENRYEYVLMRTGSLLERESFDSAEEVLNTVEEAELSDDLQAKYYWVKSSILFYSADYEEAEGWVGKAILLVDEGAEYHLLLGKILFEEGNESESKTALERAVDLDLEGVVSAEAAKVLDRL